MGRDEYREYLLEQDRRRKFQDEPEPDDEPLDLDEIDDSDEPDEWEVMDGGPPEINPTTGYPDFGGKPHPVAGSGWQDLDQWD